MVKKNAKPVYIPPKKFDFGKIISSEKDGVMNCHGVKRFQDRFMQEESNLLFGKSYGKEIGLALNPVFSQRNKNVLVLGGAGTGKTHHYIEPNLLQMNQSAVVIDFGGELYRQYGTYLADKGAKVYRISGQALSLSTDIDENCIVELGSKLTYIFIQGSRFGDQKEMQAVSEFLNKLLHGLYRFAEKTVSGETEYKSASPNQMLPFPVHFFLDEFQALNIPEFLLFLATDRKYGIGISVIVQSIEQLKLKYENNEHEIVFADCDTILFFGSIMSEDTDFIRSMTKLMNDKQKEIWAQRKFITLVRAKPPIICDKLIPEKEKT